MSRISDMDELVVAQSTQLCLRTGCCHPSINWVLNDGSNYEPGTSPFDLPSIGGWIHEESTYFQRCILGAYPGCRKTRFVHHSGAPPTSLRMDGRRCCIIQTSPTSEFLSQNELSADIVAIHEKDNSCMTGSCCFTPYLRSLDGDGRYLGETRFVCDECVFVPKFVVLDKYGETKYLLRPDTCFLGVCMRPRCGGTNSGGKCLRLPFVVRDPITYQPCSSRVAGEAAQVTELWNGLVNEACYKRHAYQVAFPSNATIEEKFTLIGSSLLIDVSLFEKRDNDKQ
eukprot:CAMPEP_0194354512 /NCGR_PEP_ID=MMETSP0174-20130528/2659_1 /TAXON_ID=216777 /ORGANISM="Proboscia alata, Strain PI-D3" /LENGTH=282 /DNA_ID=CAMNT_0039123489 /DNA_START=84 /DNA_END=932 /DNA_ORIENTATION=-